MFPKQIIWEKIYGCDPKGWGWLGCTLEGKEHGVWKVPKNRCRPLQVCMKQNVFCLGWQSQTKSILFLYLIECTMKIGSGTLCLNAFSLKVQTMLYKCWWPWWTSTSKEFFFNIVVFNLTQMAILLGGWYIHVQLWYKYI
jgi:hypothetical protein